MIVAARFQWTGHAFAAWQLALVVPVCAAFAGLFTSAIRRQRSGAAFGPGLPVGWVQCAFVASCLLWQIGTAWVLSAAPSPDRRWGWTRAL